jgi:hypothetical protein
MSASDSSPADKVQPAALDLSSLESLSLGPAWVTQKQVIPSFQEPRRGGQFRSRDDRDRPADRRDSRAARPAERSDSGAKPATASSGTAPAARPDRGARFDRRDGGAPAPAGDRGGRFDRRDGRRDDRREAPVVEAPFQPVVAVDFYPEEEPFKKLMQAIRNSPCTYELFEIAQVILAKPDRFVCLVKDPLQQEGEPARLFAAVPDGLPFRTEAEAIHHVFAHHSASLFTTESVEVSPPSGTFNLVHRCTLTGTLLAPPNYHRYQAICRAHHAAHLAHMPFERFMTKVESVHEPEAVQQWLDQMKQQTRYHLLPELAGDTPVTFENLEDARVYLLAHHRDKMVRPAYSARFSGRDIERLPAGSSIRRSIEVLLEDQLRFPLDTANHLRGRLRRLNLHIFKIGSRSVSYVSSVKRRVRKADEVLADNLTAILDFIESHPHCHLRDLPRLFLGIDEVPVAKPAASHNEPVDEAAPAVESVAAADHSESAIDAEPSAASTTVAAPDATEPAAADAVADATEPAAADAVVSPAEVPVSAEPASTDEPSAADDAAPAAVEFEAVAAPSTTVEPAPVAHPAPVAGKPKPAKSVAAAPVTDPKLIKLMELKRDLRYLINEGFVIEFSSGRLFVPPVRDAVVSES